MSDSETNRLDMLVAKIDLNVATYHAKFVHSLMLFVMVPFSRSEIKIFASLNSSTCR
jgi:hypothetical protein